MAKHMDCTFTFANQQPLFFKAIRLTSKTSPYLLTTAIYIYIQYILIYYGYTEYSRLIALFLTPLDGRMDEELPFELQTNYEQLYVSTGGAILWPNGYIGQSLPVPKL